MSSPLLKGLKIAAGASTALYTGVSFYISVNPFWFSAQSPTEALLVWYQTAKHIGHFQGIFSLLSTGSSYWLWLTTKQHFWLYISALNFINLPFTVLLLNPLVGKKLQSYSEQVAAGLQTKPTQLQTISGLLRSWHWLHSIRTTVSCVALGILFSKLK
eukprot:TRINITY_DN9797_c0_g1_i1.p2 TRINITY_DN9797_c0_g1~~TRINITY_DN9797_c0_g1_i1.p2  ORF type:complete len:158 (-),score=24.59 TRINITY_DN9797_c0_g1_i1:60-533(-)